NPGFLGRQLEEFAEQKRLPGRRLHAGTHGGDGPLQIVHVKTLVLQPCQCRVQVFVVRQRSVAATKSGRRANLLAVLAAAQVAGRVASANVEPGVETTPRGVERSDAAPNAQEDLLAKVVRVGRLQAEIAPAP